MVSITTRTSAAILMAFILAPVVHYKKYLKFWRYYRILFL